MPRTDKQAALEDSLAYLRTDLAAAERHIVAVE
jgi:hypothetical protein